MSIVKLVLDTDVVVAGMRTARFFADRKARADFKAFDKILRRRRGKLPPEGDELPDQTPARFPARKLAGHETAIRRLPDRNSKLRTR